MRRPPPLGQVLRPVGPRRPEFDEAIRLDRAALVLAPDDAIYGHNLGVQLDRTDAIRAAGAAFGRACDLGNTDSCQFRP